MKTDISGTSTCPVGKEQYETFKSGKKSYVQYDYRFPNGQLFSTVAPTLDVARERRKQFVFKDYTRVTKEEIKDGIVVFLKSDIESGYPIPYDHNQVWDNGKIFISFSPSNSHAVSIDELCKLKSNVVAIQSPEPLGNLYPEKVGDHYQLRGGDKTLIGIIYSKDMAIEITKRNNHFKDLMATLEKLYIQVNFSKKGADKEVLNHVAGLLDDLRKQE